MLVFYFTASGNSLAVAKAFNGKTISIPSALQGDTKVFEDEQIGIVCPCYVGGIPTPVEEFLATVTLRANYAFGIITCGNFSSGSTHELEKAIQRSGLSLSYLNKILMVDSSLKYYDMNAQMAKQHGKRIDDHLQAIVRDVEAHKKYKTRSNFVYKAFSNLGRRLYLKEIGDYDTKYTIEADCNNCGTCSKVCPVGNIAMNGKPTFLHNCIRCYACTHNCPKNAIRLAGEKSTARFRNERVSLSEIVAANDRLRE